MREGRAAAMVGAGTEGETRSYGGGGSPSRRPLRPLLHQAGRRGEEVEAEGGGKKLWRRKRQAKVVTRAIRDGLPAAAASCWRGVTVVEETGTRSRRRDSAADGSGRAGDNSGADGSGPVTGTAAAAWCCVCPAGDCSLQPNPSANGKEDPGVRSLLERNVFFAADCNPHADGLPSSSW